MINFAGAVFGIVVGLLAVCFAIIRAKSLKSGTAATGQQTTPRTGHVFYGVTLINDGYEYYPDWCAMMLREFDVSIKSKLEHDYGLAKSIARHPRDQWTILIAQSLETD